MPMTKDRIKALLSDPKFDKEKAGKNLDLMIGHLTDCTNRKKDEWAEELAPYIGAFQSLRDALDDPKKLSEQAEKLLADDGFARLWAENRKDIPRFADEYPEVMENGIRELCGLCGMDLDAAYKEADAKTARFEALHEGLGEFFLFSTDSVIPAMNTALGEKRNLSSAWTEEARGFLNDMKLLREFSDMSAYEAKSEEGTLQKTGETLERLKKNLGAFLTREVDGQPVIRLLSRSMMPDMQDSFFRGLETLNESLGLGLNVKQLRSEHGYTEAEKPQVVEQFFNEDLADELDAAADQTLPEETRLDHLAAVMAMQKFRNSYEGYRRSDYGQYVQTRDIRQSPAFERMTQEGIDEVLKQNSSPEMLLETHAACEKQLEEEAALKKAEEERLRKEEEARKQAEKEQRRIAEEQRRQEEEKQRQIEEKQRIQEEAERDWAAQEENRELYARDMKTFRETALDGTKGNRERMNAVAQSIAGLLTFIEETKKGEALPYPGFYKNGPADRKVQEITASQPFLRMMSKGVDHFLSGLGSKEPDATAFTEAYFEEQRKLEEEKKINLASGRNAPLNAKTYIEKLKDNIKAIRGAGPEQEKQQRNCIRRILGARISVNSRIGDVKSLNRDRDCDRQLQAVQALEKDKTFNLFCDETGYDKLHALASKGHGGALEKAYKSYLTKKIAVIPPETLPRFMPTAKERCESLKASIDSKGFARRPENEQMLILTELLATRAAADVSRHTGGNLDAKLDAAGLESKRQLLGHPMLRRAMFETAQKHPELLARRGHGGAFEQAVIETYRTNCCKWTRKDTTLYELPTVSDPRYAPSYQDVLHNAQRDRTARHEETQRRLAMALVLRYDRAKNGAAENDAIRDPDMINKLTRRLAGDPEFVNLCKTGYPAVQNLNAMVQNGGKTFEARFGAEKLTNMLDEERTRVLDERSGKKPEMEKQAAPEV